MTQHIKQMHDALQSYTAKVINVGLTIYSQILGTLSQRLGAMTIILQPKRIEKMTHSTVKYINNFIIL
jgi:hypothetical protein